MKVVKLSGPLLDYWVARAAELPLSSAWDSSLAGGIFVGLGEDGDPLRQFQPSVLWEHAGPIIEREHGSIVESLGTKRAIYTSCMGTGATRFACEGPTHLVAAMRAYVGSKFGPEVPDEVTA